MGLALNEIRLAEACDRLFADWDGAHEPGAVAAVVHRGELRLQRAWGLASLEMGAPLGPDTRMRIASMSKQVCATLFVLLDRQGVLSLDDSIVSHVPQFETDLGSATLRHLLAMQTGIYEELDLMQLACGSDPLHNLGSNADRLAILCTQSKGNFRAGTRFCYSNSSYTIAQIIAERCTDTAYGDLLRERIFGPLGMKNTSFEGDPLRACPGMAAGYERRDRGFARTVILGELSAAGGIVSTLSDLVLWHRNLRSNSLYDGDLVADLLKRPRFADGSRSEYGLGLFERRMGGRRTLWHAGNLPGWAAEQVWFPDDDVAVILLANRSDFSIVQRAREIAMLALEGRGELDAVPEHRVPEDLGGSYVSANGDTLVRLGATDGHLTINNRIVEETARGEFRPFFSEAGLRYSFAKGQAGAALVCREDGCAPLRLEGSEPSRADSPARWAGTYRHDKCGWPLALSVEGCGFLLRFMPDRADGLCLRLCPLRGALFEAADLAGNPVWGMVAAFSQADGEDVLHLSTTRSIGLRFTRATASPINGGAS